MTQLSICNDNDPSECQSFTDYTTITNELNKVGVLLQKWQADQDLAEDAEQEAVLDAYASSIIKLKQQNAFQSIDVVSLRPDHPQKAEFRNKFLAEHTHDDFEIRLFVDGSGLFYLHIDHKVYMVLCEAGDLISVPANTPHWFDMGENPSFKCIRFFSTPNGWEGNFTGSDIATRFPSFDSFQSSMV